MATKSSKYWNTREIKARERLLDKHIYDSEKALAKQYQRMEKSIQQQAESLYHEILEKAGTDKATVSDLYTFNKYYDLLADLKKKLNKLNMTSNLIIDSNLTSMYKQNYKLIGKQIGLVTKVDPKRVEKVTDNIWVGGVDWKTRLLKNNANVVQKVEDGLVDCVATGASSERLTKTLMNAFGAGFNDASRLVRTELNYVQNQSTKDKYEDAGIEEYNFLAELDERTCDVCWKLDFKRFRLDEAVVGENYPPIHPNCRCTVLAVIKDSVPYEE